MYDLVFAIRPSGWEKDARPQYRGKINIVGIEYSEHSSYDEMKRFVRFLKPQKVLSTVPCGRNLMKTSNVPLSWYKYDKPKSSSNYQPTITAYLGQKTQGKTIRPPAYEMDGMEKFISPLKLREVATNSLQIETTKCEKEQETSTNKSSKNKTRNANKLQAEHNENNNSFTVKISNATSTPKCITNNSSEDFERPEIQVKRKSSRYSKRQLQETEATNAEALKTPKIEQKDKKFLRKSLKEIQTSPPVSKEVCCKTPPNSQRSIQKEMPTTSRKLKSSPKTPTKKVLRNSLKLSEESDSLAELVTVKKIKRNTKKKILKSIKINYMSSEEFESDTPVPATRKTETVTIDDLSARQKIHENFTSKTQVRTPSCTSLQNLNTEEPPTCDEIPVSQRIYENSRSKAPSCTSSQNFKLQNIRKQPHDELQHQVLMTSRENPLFKSTSTSVASTLTEEIPPSQLCPDRILQNKFNKTLEEEHSSDGSNFKNSRQSLDTNVFVKTAQLADIVMASLNEINPDVNKDHIPSDLLSSADDDVNVLDYKKHNNNMELRSSSSTEEIPPSQLCLARNLQNKFNKTLEEGDSSDGSNFKNSWQSLDTNVFVKSILHNEDALKKFSCAQLADIVMASLNEINPDVNKDHIPSDLLSSTDDDVSVLDYKKHNNSMELRCSSLIGRKRQYGTSISQSSVFLKKSKQTLNTDTVSIENGKSILDYKSGNLETELPTSSLNRLNGQSSTPFEKSKQPEMLPVTNDKNIVDVQNFNHENELPSCSSFSARNRESSFSFKHQSSTPLRKYVNPQALLKTILETEEGLDKFNCSQLAEIVVKSINEHNPDYSKDHIPADLLSDADDDWM